MLNTALCIELKSQHRFGGDEQQLELLTALRGGKLEERHHQKLEGLARPLPQEIDRPTHLAAKRVQVRRLALLKSHHLL